MGMTVLACAVLLAPMGCSKQNQDDRVQGKMFYRGVPKPPTESNSMTVGRYGHHADYGRWNERGSANSGEWLDTSTSIGRYGTTAQSSTWAATGVGGDPIDNGRISSSYYDKGGSSQGIHGEGSTYSEYNERSTQTGNH